MNYGLGRVLLVGEKHLRLIHLAIFWVVWKERNRGTFDGMEEDMDRIRARWFQTLSFFVMSHSILTMEDLGDLIGILIEL